MLALEQVSVINDLKRTKGRKSREKANNSSVIKQSPSSPQGIYSSAGTKAPHPGGAWNDDVDPPDIHQLKPGLC